MSFAIIATLLAGALTTQQGFVSNPESKQAATGIEQRQGTEERIVETVVIEPASPAAQAAVVAAVQKKRASASAQVGPVSADSALVQIVLKGDRENAGDEVEPIIAAAQAAAERTGRIRPVRRSGLDRPRLPEGRRDRPADRRVDRHPRGARSSC